MKKLLVVLLALSVFGMFAFAEDAAAPAPVPALTTWSRFGVTLADNNGNQVQYPGWASNQNYISLGVSYDAKTFGVDGTAVLSGGIATSTSEDLLAAQTAYATTNATALAKGETPAFTLNSTYSVRNYTAWIKPFGDLVKISVGKLRNGDYRLANFDDGAFDTRLAGYGYIVQAYPVSGLTLAFLNPIANGTSAAFDASTLGGAASYAIPDIAKVIVQYLGKNSLNTDSTAQELFVGADVTAVKGLGLKIGYKNTVAEVGTINVDAKYPLLDGKLQPAAYATYKVTAADLNAKVNVAYDLGVATPSVYAAYDTVSKEFDAGLWVALPAGGSSLNVGVDVVNKASATTFAIPFYFDVAF